MPHAQLINLLLLHLLLLLLIRDCLSDPRTSVAAILCSNRTSQASTRQAFISNVVSTMDELTPRVYTDRYANMTVGSGSTAVYAFAQCLGDLSSSDCNLCFAQSKVQVAKCFTYQNGTRGGRFFLDGCYLRYDDYNFFEEATGPKDKLICGDEVIAQNQTSFTTNTLRLLRNLSTHIAASDGFLTGSVYGGSANLTAYALAQCWEVLNRSSCTTCLSQAVSNLTSCLPMREGRALNSGCYLRYSTQKFYNESTSSDLPSMQSGRKLLVLIFAICASVLASLMIGASIAFYSRKRLCRRREEKQLSTSALSNSRLNFKYETLEKATGYFSALNKLGEGGSGSVYRGTLLDGRKVAVKRLFFNTRHWVEEFFNEVDLVSKIHHKNLVKLLGCSITGPESLLVYEYIPNESVCQYLSGGKNSFLNWDVRFKIIIGIAEGLSYLHEESGCRIIHRDIKLENILLSNDFTPKIADFGLARFFPEGETHISTAVAGTFGYMAPEYIVHGKITEKVDVYSFGVVLMEIICGRRNNSCCQESLPLVQTVWRFFTSNKLLEAVSSSLKSFPWEEVARVLQVGLLCTQASSELRPSMSAVVRMLKNDMVIPMPTQPPFLNSNFDCLPVEPALHCSNHDHQ